MPREAAASLGLADNLVGSVRRFNRFYTKRIGVLTERLLDSPFSLAEVRVLWELAHRDRPTATAVGRELGLDPGYLSRILRRLADLGLVRSRRCETDGRRWELKLTSRGRKTFRPLDARSSKQVSKMLRTLRPAHRRELVGAMRRIQTLLDEASAAGPAPDAANAFVLRPPRIGDMGWVVQRHSTVFHDEYGYDQRFEALVARIVADFIVHFDPKRERCWIAERDGQKVGSVFAVKQSSTVAKLRLLMVEPSARGMGLGKRLVDECIRFAREAGYRKLVLWTQSELRPACALYQRAGFRRVKRWPHQSWGPRSFGELWDLNLQRPVTPQPAFPPPTRTDTALR
jgi:DNA-binding MarR family transcriptional regulator/GNAT superfamily N-acetyltransferase